ncbi:DUF4148 domain-containing protein [Paraburkholderia sprentiae WSM5005]|uniref:DUF4148 domain-containing protein n=1 Tax=Paraburkholderia sprentiae WSM5005 TaxID=754502 RepID=A0A1I9YRK8_9BURK|nr:DUF4148 domain-containing protein [Paraburkholderia sprentiae]APA88822.1 DUF4148 domain-containing protein [Paraburkholderia sprentiae WSM5005]
MIVLTGLVFGAVTIGAYVSQRDNDWSSGQGASLAAGGERGVSAAGQSEGGAGAAGGALVTRRHALRDDATALRAQPAASIGAQAGDALAIAALQFAREANNAQPQPQQTTVPPSPAVTPNRTQPPPAAKTGHAHPGRVASGEHGKGASGTTTKPRSAQSIATTSGTNHARGGSHRRSSTAERSAKKAAGATPQARPLPQYATQGVELPWSMPRADLTTQTATAVSSNAPKTRAEVEAELVRARENGTMPAFGRPEPTGPGAH